MDSLETGFELLKLPMIGDIDSSSEICFREISPGHDWGSALAGGGDGAITSFSYGSSTWTKVTAND